MIVSDDDRARITNAVTTAEQDTRGEIVVVLAEEVSKYDEVPLAWASAAALLVPAALALAGDQFLKLTGGDWIAVHTAAIQQTLIATLWALLAGQVAIFVMVHTFVSWRPVRRFMTPRWLKRARTHAAAMAQFLATGLDGSADRTGVVIFVALEDHIVEVIADALIHKAVGESAWNTAIDLMQSGLKRQDLAQAVEAGVAHCGRLLAAHFPQNGDQLNALPDVPKII
ncbi:MAG: TPM domain-containing protein [Caulobacterales bacterium]